MIDKEKAYNTIALKYYELEELREIRRNLITMDAHYKARVTVKTIHNNGYMEELIHFFSKKKSFNVVPELLIQIIDGLIEEKQKWLDKAIDVSLLAEKEGM